MTHHIIFFLFLFVIFVEWVVLEAEPRTSHMLSKHSTFELYPKFPTLHYTTTEMSDAWNLDLDQVKQWCQNQDGQLGQQSGVRKQ